MLISTGTALNNNGVHSKKQQHQRRGHQLAISAEIRNCWLWICLSSKVRPRLLQVLQLFACGSYAPRPSESKGLRGAPRSRSVLWKGDGLDQRRLRGCSVCGDPAWGRPRWYRPYGCGRTEAMWKRIYDKKIKEKSGIQSKKSEWYPYRHAANAWEARYGTEINIETGRMKWEDEIRKAPGLQKKM